MTDPTSKPAADDVAALTAVLRDHAQKDRWPEAARQLRRFADQGDAEARYQLGLMLQFFRSDLGAEGREDGLRVMRLAADQGHAKAQLRLGQWLFERLDTTKVDATRVAEGMRYYRLAADQGEADAQHTLARCLMSEGLGIEQDKPTAARYLRLAAEQGHADAANDLAVMLIDGGSDGTGTNSDDAERFARIAVEHDRTNDSSRKMRLGTVLSKRGKTAEAVAFLLDSHGERDACYLLASIYERGAEGVPQNLDEAMVYRRSAADGGHAQAAYELGVRLLEGLGLPPDPAEGSRYLLRAWQSGSQDAWVLLGIRVLEGRSVPPDVVESLFAFPNYVRAAAGAGVEATLFEMSSDLAGRNEEASRACLCAAAGRGHRGALSRALPLYGHTLDGLSKCGAVVERRELEGGQRVVVKLPAPARLQVRFRREGIATKVVGWFRSELQTGDEVFDRAVFVELDGDKAELSRWLGEEVLRNALRDAVTGGGDVRVEGSSVTWDQPSGAPLEAAVVRLVRLALES